MAKLPIDIIEKDDVCMVQWLDISPHEIIDPFFKHTINRLLKNGRKPSFSKLDELPLKNNQTNADKLSAIDIIKSKATPNVIFHLSRCGSTLAAQMLSQVDKVTVISEPKIINRVLSITRFSHAERTLYLKKIINLFINHIPTDYVIFKLTSWNIYHIELFYETYPKLKAVFLYRSPIEVMQSHVRHPAGWLTKRKDEDTSALINECAQHLAKMMTCALDQSNRSLLCINHNALPDALNQLIVPHFHIQHLTHSDIDAMTNRSLFYSKDKTEPFTEKTLSTPILVSKIENSHQTHTLTLYQKLEHQQEVTDWPDYYTFAKSFDDTNNVSQKIVELEKKISLDSTNLSLHKILNHIYRKTGQLEKVRLSCDTIAKLDPNDWYYARAQRIFSGQVLNGDHRKIPTKLPGEFVQFHDFLSAKQHNEVLSFVKENQNYSKYSCNGGQVNFAKRKTLVINFKEAGKPIIEIIKKHVLNVLPEVKSRLSLAPFPVKSLEMKISVHLDGFYFKAHTDDQLIPSRKMAFLYYFNFEEKAFEGGDFLLFDTDFKHDKKAIIEHIFTRIRPIDNSILFIPSGFYHAVTPVILPSNQFEQGRFCISGHVRCE